MPKSVKAADMPPKRKYFKAASEEARLPLAKAASAWSEVLNSSSEMNIISRLSELTSSIRPDVASSNSAKYSPACRVNASCQDKTAAKMVSSSSGILSHCVTGPIASMATWAEQGTTTNHTIATPQ